MRVILLRGRARGFMSSSFLELGLCLLDLALAQVKSSREPFAGPPRFFGSRPGRSACICSICLVSSGFWPERRRQARSWRHRTAG